MQEWRCTFEDLANLLTISPAFAFMMFPKPQQFQQMYVNLWSQYSILQLQQDVWKPTASPDSNKKYDHVKNQLDKHLSWMLYVYLILPWVWRGEGCTRLALEVTSGPTFS